MSISQYLNLFYLCNVFLELSSKTKKRTKNLPKQYQQTNKFWNEEQAEQREEGQESKQRGRTASTLLSHSFTTAQQRPAPCCALPILD